MDITNIFFKRIIYKKNALEDMKSYIKFYHAGKNILLLAEKDNTHSKRVISSIIQSGNAFKFCYLSDKFNYKELFSKNNNYNLIISFGNENICNLCKQLACFFECDYIICPTCPTSIFYFNEYYKGVDNVSYTKYEFPNKIFIDEEVIKNATLISCVKGLNHFCCFNELLACKIFDNEIHQQQFDFELLKCLSRFETLFKQISNGEDDGKLSLMDNIIEVAESVKGEDPNSISFLNYSNMIKKACQTNNDEYNFELIASDILLNIYLKLFEQKVIKCYNNPNYDKITNIIEKYPIQITKYKGKQYYDAIKLNKELFMKINCNKNKIKEKYEKIIENMKINIKKLNKLNNLSHKSINFEKFYDTIKILPYIYENNNLINLIGATGILNF